MFRNQIQVNNSNPDHFRGNQYVSEVSTVSTDLDLVLKLGEKIAISFPIIQVEVLTQERISRGFGYLKVPILNNFFTVLKIILET